jgi:SAM-dependent methyltransferase
MLFGTDSFDVVYSYSVLHFTPNPEEMVEEIHRVLRPGGRAILMVYNRLSWLELMARLTGVKLEHSCAPIFRRYSLAEFNELLKPFGTARVISERFPVKTRLHQGIAASLFNQVFVPMFNLIPRRFVQSYGCHLIAFAKK